MYILKSQDNRNKIINLHKIVHLQNAAKFCMATRKVQLIIYCISNKGRK